jgi:hypothetical protein
MCGRNSFIHNIRSLGHFDNVHSGLDGRTLRFLAPATSSLVPNYKSTFYIQSGVFFKFHLIAESIVNAHYRLRIMDQLFKFYV